MMVDSTATVSAASYAHATANGAAHEAWMKRQQEIAAEYHAKCLQLARWRVQAMAQADNDYRQAIFDTTEALLQAAESGLRDEPDERQQ